MPAAGLTRPASGEFAEFYAGYVAGVPDGDLIEILRRQGSEVASQLRGVSDERSNFRYEPGKWSIREVVAHMSDAERVFSYRALTFARGDTTPLPSFDENEWAKASNAGARPMSALVEEIVAVRAATVALFRGFSDAMWERWGTASNKKVTVRALGYIVAGHEKHHLRILKERYGL